MKLVEIADPFKSINAGVHVAVASCVCGHPSYDLRAQRSDDIMAKSQSSLQTKDYCLQERSFFCRNIPVSESSNLVQQSLRVVSFRVPAFVFRIVVMPFPFRT